MHNSRHPTLEQLIAHVTAGSGSTAEALIGDCARCAENMRWVRWVLDTARADRSVAPSAASLRRAFSVFDAPQAVAGARGVRRLLGEILFDSYRTRTLSFARGGAAARQLRYTVPDLALEISLQLERDTLRPDRYALTGQVLTEDAGARPPAIREVAVRAASGTETLCALYDTGEFAADALAGDRHTLLVRLQAEEIAVPVPGL